MKNNYKEYLKNKKLKEKYNEEVVIKNESTLFKILLFIFGILNKLFSLLYYIGLIILCSAGATFIANKIGIINIL